MARRMVIPSREGWQLKGCAGAHENTAEAVEAARRPASAAPLAHQTIHRSEGRIGAPQRNGPSAGALRAVRAEQIG